MSKACNSGVFRKVLNKLFTIITTLLLTVLIVGNIKIFSSLRRAEKDNADLTGLDYIVVLGNALIDDKPSDLLIARLETALEMAERFPDAGIVVSGGLTGDNTITEAAIMSRYLEQAGIDRARIIEEDSSKSTYENMVYTSRLIPGESAATVITNKFHLFRALKNAKSNGFTHVIGTPADDGSVWAMLWNRIKESFIICYDDFLDLGR